MKRSLTFSGVSLYQSSALLVTKDGEAFIAHVKPRIKKKSMGKFYKHYFLLSICKFRNCVTKCHVFVHEFTIFNHLFMQTIIYFGKTVFDSIVMFNNVLYLIYYLVNHCQGEVCLVDLWKSPASAASG